MPVRVVDGQKDESQSVLLMFDEEYLPTHVIKMGYFLSKQLQCRNCRIPGGHCKGKGVRSCKDPNCTTGLLQRGAGK